MQGSCPQLTYHTSDSQLTMHGAKPPILNEFFCHQVGCVREWEANLVISTLLWCADTRGGQSLSACMVQVLVHLWTSQRARPATP
jgi:hypothetical protein